MASVDICLPCIISKNLNKTTEEVSETFTQEEIDTNFRELKQLTKSLIDQSDKFVKQNTIDVQFAPFVALLDSLNAVLDVIAEANPAAVISALEGLISSLTAILASMTDLISIGANPVGSLKSLAFGDFVNDFNIGIPLKIPGIDGVPSYLKGLNFGDIGEIPFPEWDGSEAQTKLSELVMAGFLPLLDPLFELIKEVEDTMKSLVEGLVTSTTTAVLAGPLGVLAETPNVISGINDLIASIQKIIALIPPTNYIKNKMTGYFSQISLNEITIPTDPVTKIDLSTSFTDCLIKEITSIF